MHNTESRFVIGLTNTVLFAGMCAHFSPEILQAGTVKELS